MWTRLTLLGCCAAAAAALGGMCAAASLVDGEAPWVWAPVEMAGSASVSGFGPPEDDPDRRRPGRPPREPREVDPQNPDAARPPEVEDFPPMDVAVPDRWRLSETLGLVRPRWWDPYNYNPLKGDRPIAGTKDWFLVLTGISDTVIEPRSFPVPVGVQTTGRPNANDLFGNPDSLVFAQTAIASAALIKGSTAYKPQTLEFRATLAANFNYVEVDELRILHVEPSKGDTRADAWIGLQEAFIDYHIADISARYDFYSLRFGIQPFSSDFRGFLFQDNQLGARLFGNFDNNRWQWNLAGFARIEKDTNSGLNDILQGLREDYVFTANAYAQDLPVPGLTSQASLTVNINREGDGFHSDDNGFPVRPALIGDLRGRDYDVGYLGYSLDGRFGRLNLAGSAYYAFGENRGSPFTGEDTRISAFFAALEPSYDFDWIRARGALLYASGDEDPYDDTETGFDAIFENPQFAGADTSYWVRQTIPLIGGGRAVSLNGRNGILNSLRSSKEEGQSNFTNPGLVLVGGGVDLDLTPSVRLSGNLNRLWFEDTSSLGALRIQAEIPTDIGWDASAAVTYRPGFIQNVVLRASAATLEPGDGFDALYDNEAGRNRYYSVLFNAALTY